MANDYAYSMCDNGLWTPVRQVFYTGPVCVKETVAG
jgi:hypothetical protein